MKRILTTAALLLTIISAFAQSGKDMYRKYSDQEGVSAVYISPAMFRLIGKIPDINVEGEDVNLAPIIKSLTGLYILNAEDAKISEKIHKEAQKLIDSGRYELLMEAKDSGETVRMYTEGNDKTVTSFVLLAVDGNETSFICLDGTMPREDLENLLAESLND